LVWVAGLLGFSWTPQRCWLWFAGCAVPAQELRRMTTASIGKRALSDSYYCLDNKSCR
jgi:hypothetical protein